MTGFPAGPAKPFVPQELRADIFSAFPIRPVQRYVYEAAKKHRAPGAPAYPTFTLDDFADQTPEEIIQAALVFHTEASYRRPPGAGFSRRSEQTTGRIQLSHRQTALLLELPEEKFSTANKLDLIHLIHSREERVRLHLERFLGNLNVASRPQDIDALQWELQKVIRYGLPDPIDLAEELKRQGAEQLTAGQKFLRRLFGGEVKAFMGPATALWDNPKGRLELFLLNQKIDIADLPAHVQKPAAGLMQKFEMPFEDFTSGLLFFCQLAELTALINLARAHLGGWDSLAARLKEALARLRFPLSVPGDVQSDTDSAILGTFAHGLVPLERDFFQATHDYISVLSQDPAADRPEEHFPIVVAVEPAAVEGGKIRFDRADRIEFYVSPAHVRRLQEILQTSHYFSKMTVHPFLPLLYGVRMGPGASPSHSEVASAVRYTAMAFRAMEKVLAGLAQGSVAEEFPKEALESTRNAHRYPGSNLKAGILWLREKRGGSQRSERAIRFMSDSDIPLGVRAAFRDLDSGEVGDQVEPLIDSVLEKYAAADGPEPKRVAAREFLTGYFLHMPWAWEIMREEGLRRDHPLGLRAEAPLGVEEVLPPDRPAAWRFAYAATHLAGFSAEQAALILRIAARIPSGSEEVRRRRFERLRDLSLPADQAVFNFLNRYSSLEDPGGRRLAFLLGRLANRHETVDPQFRFRTALAQARRVFTEEIRQAESVLTAAVLRLAGGDPIKQWDLNDALVFLTYHIGENFNRQKAAELFTSIARTTEGFGKIKDSGPREEDDRLMQAIKTLAEPVHFADALRALGIAVSGGEIRQHLLPFLKREAGNLHALQYLLIAFHLQRQLQQPQAQWVRLFHLAEKLFHAENGHGKIANNQFLKYALTEVYAFHLTPDRFANEEEIRVAHALADRDDVVQVEVIEETWMGPVADFRVHLRDGGPFLVEVKTLHFENGSLESLVGRFRDQVGKAGWQLRAQRRDSADSGERDRIWVVIRVPAGRRLADETMEDLRRVARNVIEERNFLVGEIRIEQREF